MSAPDLVVDLFGGAGGWIEGLSMLPRRHRAVCVELDAAACATSKTAGHAVIRGDVTKLDPCMFPRGTRVIGSPPCQDDSVQNKRGKRGVSHLVDEPRRWISALRPRWVALEQVPAVLPRWEAYAAWLRGEGYRTWAGLLRADRYGVGQARERAFMLASLDNYVGPPEPTHSADGTEVDLFGGMQEPPVTGAAALGWDLAKVRSRVWRGDPETGDWFARRPSTTVTGTNRVPPPGYRTAGERQFGPGTIRLEVAEMGVLQSFQSDYPWQGTLGEQRQQAGNAVPPVLARRVLEVVTGVGAGVVAA